MPYIKQERRAQAEVYPDNAGELNFAITELLLKYLVHDAKPLSYRKINDVMGALEGAKLEFYRRVAVPYEDIKIEVNGDVYD
jgi:hypothetical protein